MLKISPANAKTVGLGFVSELQGYLAGRRKVYSLDLLSGWSCPGAKDCLAKVYIENNKRVLRDGPATKFRCFSASQEVLYPAVYNSRKHNLDMLKRARTWRQKADLIDKSLPRNLGILRYHVGGEFFNLSYLQAAISVAENNPDRLFYAYTKSLHFVEKIKPDCMNLHNGQIRPNFLITASYGGEHDQKILSLGIRTATVVFSEAEAGYMPIDHDDSHAATIGGSFALLLHGVQPKGSPASQALQQLNGRGSYGRK